MAKAKAIKIKQSLVRLDDFNEACASIVALDDVPTLLEVADKARALKTYHGATDAGRHAAAAQLVAERRLATLLGEAETQSEAGSHGGRGVKRSQPATALDKRDAHRIRKLRDVPMEKVQEYAKDQLEKGKAPSRTKLLREAKEAKREKERAKNRKKIKKSKGKKASPAGTFSTIIADPPWHWADMGDADQLGRAKPEYDTIPIGDLENLAPWGKRVSEFADKDAHLYLWVTNRSLPLAFRLIEPWGFRYVTALTWVKPSFGMGNYFRGQTEHVLFCVRGSQPIKRKDVGTVFHAKRGKGGHSSKPEEFFDLVESCSHGPYLNLFSRRERDDWTTWGESSC